MCAGVDVPSRDKEVQKKKPVYGDKRRKKPATQTPEGTALLLAPAERRCSPPAGHIIKISLSFPFPETSEVTSPTSETPEPVAMETEAEAPPAEPGKSCRCEVEVSGWCFIALNRS